MSPPYGRPLLPFHASLGVSHLQAPPSSPSSVDPKAGFNSSSLELLCPSAFFGPGYPSSHPLRDVRKALLCSPGCSTLRVWLPSRWLPSSGPSGTYFSPQRSWASPLEAFLSHSDRRNVSTSPLRSCASRQNLLGFDPALQRFPPAMRAVPLFATGSIKSGRGPGSLRASNLSGSLFVPRLEKASLLSDPPLGIVSRQPSRTAFDSPSGSLPQDRPGFSHHRAPACLAFRPSSLALSSNLQLPRTIFSSRGDRICYQTRSSSLCGRCRFSFRDSVSRFGARRFDNSCRYQEFLHPWEPRLA
jgi:hypothetical protein